MNVNGKSIIFLHLTFRIVTLDLFLIKKMSAVNADKITRQLWISWHEIYSVFDSVTFCISWLRTLHENFCLLIRWRYLHNYHYSYTSWHLCFYVHWYLIICSNNRFYWANIKATVDNHLSVFFVFRKFNDSFFLLNLCYFSLLDRIASHAILFFIEVWEPTEARECETNEYMLYAALREWLS